MAWPNGSHTSGEPVNWRAAAACLACRPMARAHRSQPLAGLGWAQQRLELGWAVREAFRGKGLATEIGAAGLSFAIDILKASSVIAFTERHNLASRNVMELASRNVMERLGMVLAGEIRATGLIDGKSGEYANAPFAVYVIEP
jgi:RimJ/RimL family protein N-acetyltransferase